MKKKLKVYVAGPISRGDTLNNVLTGITVGELLLKNNLIPYVPHLTYYWNKFFPHSWEEWLRMDEQWLLVCDALLRIEGESRGADREERFAQKYGIPIFREVKELGEWAKKR